MARMVSEFRFPNDKTRDREAVAAAFAEQGLVLEDLHTELYMWVWALTSDGRLWLLDKSHGGGGKFVQQR